MHKKIIALFAALLLALGVSVVAAGPAAAASKSQNVNCYGYTYSVSVTYTRASNGTITINSYSISGPTTIEWRARWKATAGNVIEDSGYQVSSTSPVNRSPGWSRYMGASTFWANVGKLSDNQPTCDVYIPIP